MTPQEIFDFVADKLAVQKRRASTNESCVYLTPDGNKCAVGHLLPELGLPEDQLAKLQCYRGSVVTLIQYAMDENIALPQWFFDNMLLLVGLQKAHDTAHNFSDKVNMAEQLEYVARGHCLDFDSKVWLEKVKSNKE